MKRVESLTEMSVDQRTQVLSLVGVEGEREHKM